MDDFTGEVQQALGDSYALERELGRGGMGTVYLARDLALDRPVAIKVLPPELAVRPELRERFLRETRTAASFSHPNIVPVHAVEERGNVLCFVMGYIEGETLTQRIRRAGPLGAADVVRLLQEVAWALSYAHGRGVVHRDIKPDNIMLERASGRALVTDFGIARSASSAAAGLTRVGDVVGTPHYMSPEQASGDVIDGRSDLYSLGVVAFSAVTGRVPFDADSTPAILAMHLTRQPPSVVEERPDLPPALASAIDRLLAKDPAERFASGEALVEAIEAAASARPQIATAIRLFQQKATQVVRNAIILVVLLPYLTSHIPGTADRMIMRAILFAGAAGLILQAGGALRELARRGFGFDDLRTGILALGAEREQERAQQLASPDWRRRRRRRWIRLGAGLVLAVLLAVWSFTFRTKVREGLYDITTFGMALALGSAMLGMFIVVTAIAGSGVSSRFERRLDRLWTGSIGRWLFGLAARGVVAGRAGPAHSAVTLAAGRSPLSVLRALPRPLRRELGAAEALIQRLQTEQSSLTAREASLDAALRDAASQTAGGDPAAVERRALTAELESAKRDIAVRREAIAAALERARLQLLRLRSGLGSAGDVSRELNSAA